MAKDYASGAMLSRTHGQTASPTTLGKELAIFAVRLSRQRHRISRVEITGKFAGPVGNYNALFVAYPRIKWPQIAKEFVTSLGIEAHDYMSTLFDRFNRFNNILVDFDCDMQRYISYNREILVCCFMDKPILDDVVK
ncbi:uncharacterized protein LOC133716889 [Rosa rugosa]|uniref:uncharacterized protein LOC133716889 n=1 Tax=Rosa rugosa TaxID=74645 RepID=UPI002B403513|nr:uncharacterized protein LOC133716889 [Rosa rugosa]